MVVAAICVLQSCSNNRAADNSQQAVAGDSIVAQTFKTADGWGYSILVNNHTFIRQSMIPVIAGQKSFAKEADAKMIGDLVVSKLKSHQKPTIHLEELQQLGITE